jgi:hypothetical protein
MRYVKNIKHPGGTQFLIDDDVNLNEFRQLIIELASELSSKVEWIAMPEAEIGKIKLSSGEIYAKLDFEYGLELDCDGCMNHEIMKIEATLSEK